MLRPIVRDLEKEGVEAKMSFEWQGEEHQHYVKKDISYLIEPDCAEEWWVRFLEDIEGVCTSLRVFHNLAMMVPQETDSWQDDRILEHRKDLENVAWYLSEPDGYAEAMRPSYSDEEDYYLER